MNSVLPVLLSMCLLQPALQDQNGKPAVAPAVTAPVVVKQPLAFGLEDGTPVKLKLNRTISSADAHVNDTVDFEVLEQVTVKDDVIIPRESMAWGTVTEAEPKRRMARGGSERVHARGSEGASQRCFSRRDCTCLKRSWKSNAAKR